MPKDDNFFDFGSLYRNKSLKDLIGLVKRILERATSRFSAPNMYQPRHSMLRSITHKFKKTLIMCKI